MKTFLRWLILFGLLAGLWGCTATPASPTPAPVQITFYKRGYTAGGTDVTSTTIDQAVRAFEQKHPNIQVEVVGLDWTPEASAKLEEALKLGKDIDVLSVNSNDLVRFARLGYLADVDSQLTPADRDDFFASGVAATSADGKMYAWPLWATTAAMYANPELLKERGVEPPSLEDPWTWDEFVQAAQKLTFTRPDGSQVYGFSAPSKPGVTLYTPLLYIDGGRVLSPDGRRFVQNSPEAISALQKIADLAHKYKVTPPDFGNVDQAGVREQLKAGTLAMILDTPNTIPEFERNKVNFIALPPPTGDAGKIVTVGGFGMYGVFKSDDPARVQAAHEFARYLTSAEVARDVPGYQQAPSLRRSNTTYATDPAREMIARLVSYAVYDSNIPIAPEVFNAYHATLNAIILGQKTPQQAIDEIAPLYQAELDAFNR